mmetsp:Transcript_19/g.45  ORF Transcript_19/g.45 Transcript_19/m.45 type:complete len:215 (-) Transcript_19:1339-1983(-)
MLVHRDVMLAPRPRLLRLRHLDRCLPLVPQLRLVDLLLHLVGYRHSLGAQVPGDAEVTLGGGRHGTLPSQHTDLLPQCLQLMQRPTAHVPCSLCLGQVGRNGINGFVCYSDHVFRSRLGYARFHQLLQPSYLLLLRSSDLPSFPHHQLPSMSSLPSGLRHCRSDRPLTRAAPAVKRRVRAAKREVPRSALDSCSGDIRDGEGDGDVLAEKASLL